MDEPTRTLVSRAQADDRTAAGQLFDRYHGRIRRALARMTASDHERTDFDADDLLQEAMLAALRGIGSFEYRGEGSFLAWLLQTARNVLRHRIRAARTKKRSGNVMTWSRVGEPTGPEATPSEVAMGNELEDRVQSVLDDLPENQRTVIVLARYFDCSAAEIAEKMELPTQNAARAQLARAQARLARMLAEPEAGRR